MDNAVAQVRAPADRAAAWDAVYVQLRPTLFRGLVAASGSYDGVEDAIQDAFAAVLRKDPADYGSVEGYLFVAALNNLRDRHRRAALFSRLRLRPAPQPHELDGALRRADLQRSLMALPRRDRELLVAKYYVGMTQDEIAKRMGVPRGTVAAALSRAASRFRDLRRGGGPDGE